MAKKISPAQLSAAIQADNLPGVARRNNREKTPPDCQLCKENFITTPAVYDARLPGLGVWAYVCQDCFNLHRCTTGIGRGQLLWPTA